MNRIKLPVALLAVAGLVVACSDDTTGPLNNLGADMGPLASTAIPVDTEAAQTCTQLFGYVDDHDAPDGIQGFKIDKDDLANARYEVASGLWIDLDNVTATSFDWESNFSILLAYAKSGRNASNLYSYMPYGSTGDEGLSTRGGHDISHILFCYVEALAVSKTADAGFHRAHDWSLTKTAVHEVDGEEELLESLVLMPGVQASVSYRLATHYTGYDDAAWYVAGTVTVANPWDNDAVISELDDVLDDDVPVDLHCGEGFDVPYTLAAGETLTCTYKHYLGADTDGTNTVTVVTTAGPMGGSAHADFTFGAPSTEADFCISIYDDLAVEGNAESLGTLCADDLDLANVGVKRLFYSGHFTFGPEYCDDAFDLVNTAWATLEDETVIDASWTIAVTMDCPVGCTLSQGYWKTHSPHGPAPEDETGAWGEEGYDPDDYFYYSGESWYDLFWTAPRGNAYILLAKQYMAARLNIAAGADYGDVEDALGEAKAFFYNAEHTLDYVAGLRGNNPVRANLLALAEVLDDYNNGIIGPGKCINGGSYDES